MRMRSPKAQEHKAAPRLWCVCVCVLALAACGDESAGGEGSGGGGGAANAGVESGECVDDADYFEDVVWAEVVQPICVGCHVSDGVAASSDLVFVSAANAGFLETNREILADVAGLERDGTSIILLKPSLSVDHAGGEVAPRGSDAYRILESFVRRVDRPVECAEQDDDPTHSALALHTPSETLRKASLLLIGDLPNAAAFDSVRAGGEAELTRQIDALLDDPRFVDRTREWFNDLLLTDKYIGGTDAIGFTDYDRFPGLYWFEGMEDSGGFQSRVNDAIAREPIELVAHIVQNDLPFTEVLTADYVMVNDYSAVSYGLQATAPSFDHPAALTFRPAQLEGLPHAGVLTTPAFLNRYPTTDTNRNRHRTWVFFRLFLATDILTLADRPVDITSSTVHNPTMNDGQCTVCHAVMDPVAGSFQNWTTDGIYDPPEEGWYPDMRPPGFGDAMMPSQERPGGLQWLAAQTAGDARFSIAVVENTYHVLMGREPVSPGVEDGTPEASARQEAWTLQRESFERIARRFEESGYNYKTVVRELVLSPWFRAAGAADEASAGVVLDAGRHRLLTPEELDRSIEALTGYRWADGGGESRLREDYAILYGGIDSDAIVERLEDPNGVMIAIAERMAVEVACRHLPRDLSLDPADRVLMPFVDGEVVPETEQGFAIPEAEQAIRENIRYLLLRLLGEEHALDSVEVDVTYELFVATWQEGRALVASGDLDNELPWECQSRTHVYTGAELPDSRRVDRDRDYVIRAWMATLTYLLRDIRFLYQ